MPFSAFSNICLKNKVWHAFQKGFCSLSDKLALVSFSHRKTPEVFAGMLKTNYASYVKILVIYDSKIFSRSLVSFV